MLSKSGRLKKIGIWLAIWGFVKTIWDAIGHIGNVQTLWDMISAAVQYWPSFLREIVWVATSWWFALIASTVCLLLWWFLSRNAKSFAAVTFDDAIIVPSGHGDRIQRLVHHPISDVTAKLLPEKQGLPVLVEIINKSNAVARLHTARLLGINGNGNEELLLGPSHIVAIHEWKALPFVMEPKSRVSIAFAGMNLERLPKKFVAYLVEVELEDETKIRTDERIKRLV